MMAIRVPTTPTSTRARLSIRMKNGAEFATELNFATMSPSAIGTMVAGAVDNIMGRNEPVPAPEYVPASLSPGMSSEAFEGHLAKTVDSTPEVVWPEIGDMLTNEDIYGSERTFKVIRFDQDAPYAFMVDSKADHGLSEQLKVALPLSNGWEKLVTAPNGSAVEESAPAEPHVVHAAVSDAVDRYVAEKHAKLSAFMRAQIAGALKKMMSPNITSISQERIAEFDRARLGRAPVPIGEGLSVENLAEFTETVQKFEVPATTELPYGEKHLMVSNHVEAKYADLTEEQRLSIYNQLLAMMDEGAAHCTPAFVADLDSKRLNGPLLEAVSSVLPDFARALSGLSYWQANNPQNAPANVVLAKAVPWIRQVLIAGQSDVNAGRTPHPQSIALARVWEVN